MAKFCTKCGASCDDNTAFCTSCGAKFDAATSAPAGSASGANGGSEKTILDKFKESANMETIKSLSSRPDFTKIVGIAVVAVAALIILIILISILGGAWKKPVKNMFKGMRDCDAEKLIEVTDEYRLDKFEDSYKGSDKSYDETLEKRLEDTMDQLEDELGKDVKISYDITDKDKLSDRDLDDIKDILKKSYDAKGVKVTKGYELDIEYTAKGKKDDDDDDGKIVVVKIDGDWYLWAASFDGVLGKVGYTSVLSGGGSVSLGDYDLSGYNLY